MRSFALLFPVTLQLTTLAAHGVRGTSLPHAGVAAPTEEPSFLFILGDDIGWADFSYNNGTAKTPNVKEWTERDGTVKMQDFHSGGTVCSPTRATVLTGRNHFRDCVNFVYGCSDMTECVPSFNFAPQSTYTVPMLVRDANKGYESWFGGKWHLGSFYNDSSNFGGIYSSPIKHGFTHMNATVEVAPTATTNCECSRDWIKDCDFGHDQKTSHCSGGASPSGGPRGCCFNYWWNDPTSAHGVTNLTNFSPDNDANDYLASAFVGFAESRAALKKPFMAQISFHNCHIPYIGTPTERAKCKANETCQPPLPGSLKYSSSELDFYSCLNEFDEAVGTVLSALKRLGYYNNTMIWFTTDNGPEVNCSPEGRCGGKNSIPPGTLHRPDSSGPGSAGVLRGRKRDVWEGGHRVPGIISWPAIVRSAARESWAPVVTMDFMATVMDAMNLTPSTARPTVQKDWAFDGVSVLPILRGEEPAPRGIGWMYDQPTAGSNGYAFRYGKWKYVAAGVSCRPADATFNCSKPQLYDMSTDYAENHDLSTKQPDIFAAIAANFSVWFDSIHASIANESYCDGHHHPPRPPSPPSPHVPFPKNPTPSTACTFNADHRMNGADVAKGSVGSREECCGACIQIGKACGGADFQEASPMRPTFEGVMTGGTCHIKSAYDPRAGGFSTAIKPSQ